MPILSFRLLVTLFILEVFSLGVFPGSFVALASSHSSSTFSRNLYSNGSKKERPLAPQPCNFHPSPFSSISNPSSSFLPILPSSALLLSSPSNLWLNNITSHHLLSSQGLLFPFSSVFRTTYSPPLLREHLLSPYPYPTSSDLPFPSQQPLPLDTNNLLTPNPPLNQQVPLSAHPVEPSLSSSLPTTRSNSLNESDDSSRSLSLAPKDPLQEDMELLIKRNKEKDRDLIKEVQAFLSTRKELEKKVHKALNGPTIPPLPSPLSTSQNSSSHVSLPIHSSSLHISQVSSCKSVLEEIKTKEKISIPILPRNILRKQQSSSLSCSLHSKKKKKTEHKKQFQQEKKLTLNNPKEQDTQEVSFSQPIKMKKGNITSLPKLVLSHKSHTSSPSLPKKRKKKKHNDLHTQKKEVLSLDKNCSKQKHAPIKKAITKKTKRKESSLASQRRSSSKPSNSIPLRKSISSSKKESSVSSSQKSKHPNKNTPPSYLPKNKKKNTPKPKRQLTFKRKKNTFIQKKHLKKTSTSKPNPSKRNKKKTTPLSLASKDNQVKNKKVMAQKVAPLQKHSPQKEPCSFAHFPNQPLSFDNNNKRIHDAWTIPMTFPISSTLLKEQLKKKVPKEHVLQAIIDTNYNLEYLSLLFLKGVQQGKCNIIYLHAAFNIAQMTREQVSKLFLDISNNPQKGTHLITRHLFPHLHSLLEGVLQQEELPQITTLSNDLLSVSQLDFEKTHCFIIFYVLVAHQLFHKLINNVYKKKWNDTLLKKIKALFFSRIPKGKNMLYIALLNGNLPCIKWLVEKNHMDLYVRDHQGKTFMDYFDQGSKWFKKRTYAVAQYIHQKKVSSRFSPVLPPNLKNVLKETLKKGDWKALKQIFSKKPSLSALKKLRYKVAFKEQTYELPIAHFAVFHFTKNHARCLKWLLQQITLFIFERDNAGNHLLTFCALINKLAPIPLIMETFKHLDIDSRNMHGKAALHYFIEHKNFSAVTTLIEAYQSSIHVMDKHGHTPLVYACLHGPLFLIPYLIQKGALPYETYGTCSSALTICLKRKMFASLHKLFLHIKEKKQLYILQPKGSYHLSRWLCLYPPSTNALYVQYMVLLRLMLENKLLDPLEEDPSDMTFLDCALSVKWNSAIQLIQKYMERNQCSQINKKHSYTFLLSPSCEKEEEKLQDNINHHSLALCSSTEVCTQQPYTTPIPEPITQRLPKWPLALPPPQKKANPSIISLNAPLSPQSIPFKIMLKTIEKADFSAEALTQKIASADPIHRGLHTNTLYCIHALIYMVYLLEPYATNIQVLNIWVTWKNDILKAINKHLSFETQQKVLRLCITYTEQSPKWPNTTSNMVYFISGANNLISFFLFLHNHWKINKHERDSTGRNFIFVLRQEELFVYAVQQMGMDPCPRTALGESLTTLWHKAERCCSTPQQLSPLHQCMIQLTCLAYTGLKEFPFSFSLNQTEKMSNLESLIAQNNIKQFKKTIKKDHITRLEIVYLGEWLAKTKKKALLDLLIRPNKLSCFYYMLEHHLISPLYRDYKEPYPLFLHRLAKLEGGFAQIARQLKVFPYLDINSKDSHGQTPFYHYLEAYLQGKIKKDNIVDFIALGADPHIINWKKQNMLFSCIEHHRLDVAKKLISIYQVNPNLSNHLGISVVQYAFVHGAIDILTYLIGLERINLWFFMPKKREEKVYGHLGHFICLFPFYVKHITSKKELLILCLKKGLTLDAKTSTGHTLKELLTSKKRGETSLYTVLNEAGELPSH